jgi:glycine betaine/proline transport system ATP-binding protein
MECTRLVTDNPEPDAKIQVRNLSRIFGPQPEETLIQLEQGQSKDSILEATGHVVGVYDASFDVRPGEIFIIMGLSGSGKSTLVRMLNRLIEPTRGDVSIEGADILGMSHKELIELRRRDIAMVFQHFALMPHLTNFENAAFGLDIAGIKDPERSRRVGQALETVGLSAFADNYPYELSGGMQQRVGLARALSLEPTIMLMDEAFSALDPLIRAEMQDELVKIQRERGITVVFISHDLREALRIGDRLAIMQAGEIVQIGTPRDLILKPANKYVRSFLEEVDTRQVLIADDLAEAPVSLPEAAPDLSVRQVLDMLEDNSALSLVIRTGDGRYQGTVSRYSLLAAREAGREDLAAAYLDNVTAVTPNQGFYNMVDAAAAAAPYPLPVVDHAGYLQGTVSQSAMLRTLQTREEAPS